MSERVCEFVHPENMVNTTCQQPVKGISSNFGHRCIRVHRMCWLDVGVKRSSVTCMSTLFSEGWDDCHCTERVKPPGVY